MEKKEKTLVIFLLGDKGHVRYLLSAFVLIESILHVTSLCEEKKTEILFHFQETKGKHKLFADRVSII